MEADFTVDWTSGNFHFWRRFIPPGTKAILEIGSWEGRSAIFFLDHCPGSRITCIDTFAGSPEHTDMVELGRVEQRFDRNLAPYGDRVEKVKARSIVALDQLGQQGRSFGLVYVDGSHARDDVIIDSFLAWRLLENGGTMIWDDYSWGKGRASPKQGIDLFLKLHFDELECLNVGQQVIVRKLGIDASRKIDFGWRFPRTPRNFWNFVTGRPVGGIR